jgi:polyisoprenoid-binding protein YceI
LNRSISPAARATALFTPLALVAVGLLSIVAPVSAQDSTPAATQIGVLDTEATDVNCSTDAATPSPLTSSVATTYTVVSDESEARYKVEEELASKGATTAVGATNAVIGALYFDSNGLPVTCTRIDVDLRTLVSDESRRDNAVQTQGLETATYPLATFILTSVEGLDTALVDGQQTTFTLIGNLTLHGETRVVAWEATVTKDGDSITGDATTTFDMPEFGITPPKMGPVLSIADSVTLEMDLTAKMA